MGKLRNIDYTPKELLGLNGYLKELSIEEVLRWAWFAFAERASIGTSFQGGGLVTMHAAYSKGLLKSEAKPIKAERSRGFDVFTIDTGFLFPETLDLKLKLEDKFKIKIGSVRSDLSPEKQEEILPKLWETDPALCCTKRKILPQEEKLEEVECWITGIRRHQTLERSQAEICELYRLQSGRQILKLNPVVHWSREKIDGYITKNKVPYNLLYDKGYRSIGCMQCTSSVEEGGEDRSGRWLGKAKTECGLHLKK